MKKSGLALLLLATCIPAAHAQLSMPKGSKATIKVSYEFSSQGGYTSPSRDQKRQWQVRRVVELTAIYAADAPQPFGVLRKNDQMQTEQIANLKQKVEAQHSKQAPMMADMMKIVADCKQDQACIEKKVSEYGNAMAAPTDVKERQAAIGELGKPGAPRFQMWRSVSQDGTYNIAEHVEFQVYELTCTDTKVCKRVTDTSGGGPASDPASTRSVAGASMFEVDTVKGNVVIQLPVALRALPTRTKVVTTIPGDKSADSEGFAKPMINNVKPITVSLKGGLNASGTERIPIPGRWEEGGLLTISWSLKVK